MKYILSALLTICLLSLLIIGKGQESPINCVSTVPETNPIVKYGIGSYYAKKFEGRETTTGAIFRCSKLTAACNTLPLNTWVRVTNLKNNKSVIVKINDRMHYLNKRLIDLSPAAAKEIGYIGQGLAKVKVEVIPTPKKQVL
jgi:rare lipoprotein A